ncbi:HlyD family efflux transporter periplasmic adaptor subunit [Ruegeria profundi]|uniref:Uncharacterized protein n=1 Tax=Ruegeria profundi TaxID=1685378 RepID=A0A0X3U345_9RHOB|nr:HlyD family efflux transporter periplasmic adaptor subunit [Ruegeria profundi]KUJ80070.1 hypothetical protein AVO44_07860 [Ruegeria profundi]
MTTIDTTVNKHPDGSRRYHLGKNALVSLISDAGSDGVVAFVKNTETGALYRMGEEEFLLLNGLTKGFSHEGLATALSSHFRIVVNASTVAQFAEQMVQNGILVAVLDSGMKPPLHLAQSMKVAAEDSIEDSDLAASDWTLDEEDGSLGATVQPDNFQDENIFSDDTDFDWDDDDGFEDRIFGDEDLVGVEDIPAEPQISREGTSSKRYAIANDAVTERQQSFERAKKEQPKIKDMDIVLFDPTGLLRFLNRFFGFAASILAGITVPLGIFAIVAIFHRLDEVLDTIYASRRVIGIVGILAISMLSVSLVSRLVIGAVLQRNGSDVKRFGINFLFFLIPRFAIDMIGVSKLDRHGKIQVYASALRTRFLIFALCTLIWAFTRQSGSSLSQVAAIIGQFGLLSFLISGFPLINGEGYRLMCVCFSQPMLRERSMAYLFGVRRKNFGPETPGERWTFILYGIGSLLTSAFLVTLVAAYVSTMLEARFGGTGVIVFLSLIALILAWFVVTRGRSKRIRQQVTAEMVEEKKAEAIAFKRVGRGQNLPVPIPAGLEPERVQNQLPAKVPSRRITLYRPLPDVYGTKAKNNRRGIWLRRIVVLSLVLGAIYVAFLPYNYQSGGDFVILADDRVKVVARVPNELTAVMVEEGDIVESGDILALQDSVREEHALAVTRAELAKARAQLERLELGATEEEIQVAIEQIERIRSELPFLEAEADRAQKLLERGAIPTSQAERTISNFNVAKAELRSAEANLNRVAAEAEASEIAMVQADVNRLQSELAFNETKLGYTKIVAPVAGRVVFQSEEPVPGQFLETGDLLMEIEDHTVARAEIKVPEADVSLIEVGEKVRLKAWAMPDEEREGVVSAIAPVAETEEFGQVVRIKTFMSNENGLFRPGMTGYAKIDGEEMRVWEAYSRLLVRFFLIEIWGWIP